MCIHGFQELRRVSSFMSVTQWEAADIRDAMLIMSRVAGARGGFAESEG